MCRAQKQRIRRIIHDSVSLTVVMIILGASSLARGAGATAVVIKPGFVLYKYIRGEKPPANLGDIERQLHKSFALVIQATNSKSHKEETIHNCDEWQKAYEEGFAPKTQVDQDFWNSVGLSCMGGRLLLSAQPANVTYLDNLAVDKRLPRYLPASFKFRVAPDDRPSHAPNWAAATKHLKMTEKAEGGIVFETVDAYHVIDIFGYGDFDHDGIQDMLLRLEHSVKQGTYSTAALYVMSRKDHSSVLSIKQEYPSMLAQ